MAKKEITPWERIPEEIRDGLQILVAQYVQMNDEFDRVKAARDKLSVEVQAYMALADAEKVLWQDRPVSVVNSSSAPILRKEKLLLKGVPAETIVECTDPGTPYSYVLVGDVKVPKPAKS